MTHSFRAGQALRAPEVVQQSALLVAENDHRIANSLSLAAAMLRLQRQKLDDAVVRQALLDAEMRIASIAHVHAYLHRHDSAERVDLGNFLREALAETDAAIGIRCSLSADGPAPMMVSARFATRIAIIVNELALNALKHGYGGSAGGVARIGLATDPDGQLQLTFADAGTGLPANFDPGQGDGLGLRIVTSLVEELEGTLSCCSDGGARFTIVVPPD
ncbi:sensor histidine kinase [uncultured Paracoccus sp.]|uniref:sensor histidine kinase n=1 Tax=uncultured Paracoccus sp. TaxID=189685 RepID=UPI00261B6F16|nr:sensor histidine kinase [uncultured Paracoccus sp.]